MAELSLSGVVVGTEDQDCQDSSWALRLLAEAAVVAVGWSVSDTAGPCCPGSRGQTWVAQGADTSPAALLMAAVAASDT